MLVLALASILHLKVGAGPTACQRGRPQNPGAMLSFDRFTVKAGEEVSIPVPEGVNEGDELRLIASNAIKRRYPTGVPKKVQNARLPVHMDVALKVKPGGERLSELGMPGLIEIVLIIHEDIHEAAHVALLIADAGLDAGVRILELFNGFADVGGIDGHFGFVAGQVTQRRGDTNQVSHGSVLSVYSGP